MIRYKGENMKKELRFSTYKYIKNKILNNEYKPNQLLNDKEISDLLSISKTLVKEAFFSLENENFLIINSRKSVLVKEVDLKLIKDVFQVRFRVEPVLVELTLNNCDKSYLNNSLLKFKADFEKLFFLKKIDTEEFDLIYDNYRHFFANNCGNLFFVKQMNLVYEHLHRIRKVLYGNKTRRYKAVDEHILIIDSIIKDKPVEDIIELCRQHIEAAQTDFFKNLDNINI